MRVSAHRLGQLVQQFLSVKPATVLVHTDMFAALRRRRHHDSFSTRTVLDSPISIGPDCDSKFDVETETVPDDRTLVESRRASTLPDESDSISLSDPYVDKICLKTTQYATTCPLMSSELPVKQALLSIIYPLPTSEDLLAHEPTLPPPTVDTPSITPPLCISRALSPPPTHYKRRRACIISSEDHNPGLDPMSVKHAHLPPPNNIESDNHGLTCKIHIDPCSPIRFPF
ncbi:hypothetical protein B0F90DRAFT_1762680 [Multifurca ochricompacta]|uniref:Uncharacterized protein n=1 Tax=Multifurca ochricompacta TaxID=376703 RepID=A0AAD4LWN1_9AGAM|nr:hypothetical protein B0F90DRAFT_1762680 [Multifurca ochricompacta]